MHLVHELSEGYYFVRQIVAEGIQIGDRVLTKSFVLTPNQCVEEFAPRTLAEIDNTAIESLLTLNPTLVVIGTGTKQVMPSPSLMAAFLTRGIGLECMNNAAAARTFNLLASEGRQVVAIFLLD